MLTVSFEPLHKMDTAIGRAVRISSDRGDLSDRAFFYVPGACEPLVSVENDAFLPYLAALSLARGEDLDLGWTEVDAQLLRNVRAAQRQQAVWHPDLTVPAIHSALPTDKRRSRARGLAAIFSADIASQFMLWRHSGGRASAPEAAVDRDVDFALHLFHTEKLVPMNTATLALRDITATAKGMGVPLIPVMTNMKTLDPSLSMAWEILGVGAGSATALHMLGRGIGQGLIGSSQTYGAPWQSGTNPVTDPLYSSSGLGIVHDGATFSFAEKTAALAQTPALLAGLKVCRDTARTVEQGNCGRCPDCLQAMITLDLLGKANADACPSFDWLAYDPERFARLSLRSAADIAMARDLSASAGTTRPEIAAACDAAVARARTWWPLALAGTAATAIGSAVQWRPRGLRGRDVATSLRGWLPGAQRRGA